MHQKMPRKESSDTSIGLLYKFMDSFLGPAIIYPHRSFFGFNSLASFALPCYCNTVYTSCYLSCPLLRLCKENNKSIQQGMSVSTLPESFLSNAYMGFIFWSTMHLRTKMGGSFIFTKLGHFIIDYFFWLLLLFTKNNNIKQLHALLTIHHWLLFNAYFIAAQSVDHSRSGEPN